LIACLVALDRQIGVDVENIARGVRLLEIADRHFCASEARALRFLPPGARQDRFFEYWTLKESFIKAIGVGISFGMAGFSFDLDERPIRMRFAPGVPQNADIWRFSLHRPLPGYVLAACARAETGEDVQVVLRETVPLAGP
jgi:4'-phosphopantetheinyl transferase